MTDHEPGSNTTRSRRFISSGCRCALRPSPPKVMVLALLLAAAWGGGLGPTAAAFQLRHRTPDGLWRGGVSTEVSYSFPLPPPPMAFAVWQRFLSLYGSFAELGMGPDVALFRRWAVLHGERNEHDLQVMLALYLWFERHRHA